MSNNNVQSLIPTNETLRQEVMEEPIVSMSLVGSAWRITLSDLGERFANFIADVYKIDEIAGVMFIPDYDPNKRNLTERTQCFAIFDVRGVNPNTVMRSYEKLTDAGIIFNKRGIGYFIADDARDIVLKEQREEFIRNEVPKIRKRMALLGLSPEEVF